jgi:uncharacterized pyridoxal phosphate-containing UPF0001 family protein
MINSVNNLISIQETLEKRIKNFKPSNIIAVSKTFPIENIYPLINYGHQHYGENKVQEAIEKWTDIKQDFINIKLHMIGKLQTNKVKHAVQLFDYIHKIFIQVNIGSENQKNGIEIENLKDFYLRCKNDLDLNIVGLMCLPPKNNLSYKYFTEMKKLLSNINEKELSMGMSTDFIEAAENGSTFLRIGSKIFGKRG